MREAPNTTGSQGNDHPVSIFFEDPKISVLFARLLQAMGVPIQLLNDLSELDDTATKIITEPQFFKSLADEHRDSCLVIGNRSSLVGIDALSISQPLTEKKIEDGLAKFLDGERTRVQ